jgi:hypothetical protein
MRRAHLSVVVPGIALLSILSGGCGTDGASTTADDAATPGAADGTVDDSGEPSSNADGSSSLDGPASPDDAAGADGAAGTDAAASADAGADAGAPADAAASTDAGAHHDAAGNTDASADAAADAAGNTDAGAPLDPSVYQHHKNPSRDGVYTDPAFTKGAAATTHVLSGFTGTVSVGVRAQPLYVLNGPSGHEAFVVATEDNHVTTYDATTGAVLWDKGPTTYGAPATGNFPCGNLNPQGITGTPIIDIASRTIYFDAMTTADSNVTLKHLVYAVKLDDGTVLPNWPVDVNATVTGFDSRHQNQRGALQLLGGVVYVPYGGNDGDCDPYFGWVLGFSASDPQHPKSWHTKAARGGIWGAGALPTDGTSIFPITGNTEGTTAWGGGEAVIRLTAGLTFSSAAADYYAPTNWSALDAADKDLGGASEVLFDMPGTPKPHLVAVGGKDQNLYVLDRDNLGGIGGELLKTSVASDEINGAPAVYTTSLGTYVAFRVANGGHGTGCPAGQGTGNLVVAKITAGATYTAKVAWCSNEANLGSPMVTTTDGKSNAVVWDANDHLWGYDGDTGAKVLDGTKTKMGTSMQYFNTPIDAKGRIAVGVDGQLYVFTP